MFNYFNFRQIKMSLISFGERFAEISLLLLMISAICRFSKCQLSNADVRGKGKRDHGYKTTSSTTVSSWMTTLKSSPHSPLLPCTLPAGTPVINFATDGADFWSDVSRAYFDFCKQACTNSDASGPQGHCSKCYCDDACFVYGDCCPDLYVGSERPSVHTGSERTDLYAGCKGDGLPQDLLSAGVSCSRTSFGRTRENNFLLLSDCPKTETNRTIINLCTSRTTRNWKVTQPVTDVNTFVTYKNIYCAQCHGVADPVPWEMQITVHDARPLIGLTSSKDIYRAVMSGSGNEITYNPPTTVVPYARKCRPAISRCDVNCLLDNTGRMINPVRVAFSTPIKNTQNSFSFLCNSNLTWCQLFTRIDPELLERFDATTSSSASLMILLSFDDDDDKVSHASNEVCDVNQFWDVYDDKCRDVICAFGKKLRSNGDITCESNPRRSNLYGYQFCFQTTISTLTREAWQKDQQQNDIAVFFNASLIDMELTWVSLTIFDVLSSESNDSEKTFLIIAKYVTQKPIYRDDLDRKLISNLPRILADFKRVFSLETIQLSITCSVAVLRHLSPYGHLTVGDIESFQSTLDVSTATYSLSVDQLYNVQHLSNLLHGIAYLPVSEHLLCPAVQLGSEEFFFEPKTHTVIIAQSGQRVATPFAYITDQKVTLVCLEKYQQHRQGRQDFPLEIISHVAMAISLAALFISLIIYCSLPSLRTIAGINNMTLIIALFWAQIFLEVGTGVKMTDWLCQAVGVATHFLWLCVTFAQNVCSFHMFYTLAFPLQSHTTVLRHTSTVRKYVFYIIFTSVAFVVGTLAWQMATEGDTGYGGQNCYLRRSLVRLVSFGLPLALTVIVNVTMYVITVIRLRYTTHVESSGSSKVGLLTYTKLSVLTGVTWLLGILASFLMWNVLAYIFAILQGCQGLFVFLAFMANKRVVTMLRSEIRQMTSSGSRRTVFKTDCGHDLQSSTKSRVSVGLALEDSADSIIDVRF